MYYFWFYSLYIIYVIIELYFSRYINYFNSIASKNNLNKQQVTFLVKNYDLIEILLVHKSHANSLSSINNYFFGLYPYGDFFF